MAFVVDVVSTAVLFVSIVIAFNKPLRYLGAAGLIATSVLNVWLRPNRNKIGAVPS